MLGLGCGSVAEALPLPFDGEDGAEPLDATGEPGSVAARRLIAGDMRAICTSVESFMASRGRGERREGSRVATVLGVGRSRNLARLPRFTAGARLTW